MGFAQDRGVLSARHLLQSHRWVVEGFEEITIRHSKYAPDRWLDEALPALESYAEKGVARLQEGVERAKAAKLVKDDEEAMVFLHKRNFEKSRAERILTLVKTQVGHPGRTAWDFANGIAAIARGEINNNERVRIELRARKSWTTLRRNGIPGTVIDVP